MGIYTPKHTFVYPHTSMLKKMCTHTNSLALVNFVLQSFSSVNCILFRHHYQPRNKGSKGKNDKDLKDDKSGLAVAII